MLVYKQDGDIFAILREALKGVFDGSIFGLLVDDEEVLLGVWRCGNVLSECQSEKVGMRDRGGRTPTPARRRPVTESWVGDK